MTGKKRGVCLGTDFGLHFQGISNSSSSECDIYLGNYEKSYNNVLFAAFIIGSPGSECSQPPNHKQRWTLPSGSQAPARCWQLGLRSLRGPGVARPGVRRWAPANPEWGVPPVTALRGAGSTSRRKKPGTAVVTTTMSGSASGLEKR